jgi:hypothetical protein
MPKPIASRCNSAACVAVTEHADGIDFTSTLGADKGRVTYNRAEVAQFLGDVKAGHYDRFLEAVPAAV